MVSEYGLSLDRFKPRVPNTARMYDYYLGGKDNFAADREVAEKVMAIQPATRALARANRRFIARAVTHAIGAGITQIIDLGTGLPTAGNVHEAAHAIDPACRVVYVDNDPVVLTHGRAILRDVRGAVYVDGDLRRPEEIIADPAVRSLIDFDRPVAVLAVSVLHCLADEEDPWATIRAFREVMAPDSLLVISHITADDKPETTRAGAALYASASTAMVPRTREQVLEMFDGFELLEPGLVHLPEWHPEIDASAGRAGHGRTGRAGGDTTDDDLPGDYWGGVGRRPR